MSRRWLIVFVVLMAGLALVALRGGRRPDAPLSPGPEPHNGEALLVGFAEKDITPTLGGKPVFMAGFGQNRRATGVHDPLMARAVVLQQGPVRLALVAVDLVGLFRPVVLRVRKKLPGYTHVLVCSTHNHEGPDSMGLWGPRPFASGADPDYLAHVESQVVAAVEAAGSALRPARASLGTARAPELLHDGREPFVKHDELTAIEFRSPSGEGPIGLVVQWNCHPETLDSRNTRLSADFVGASVRYLNEKRHCPVLYLTGTVGGLMTSLHVPVKDDRGRSLDDGTFEKTERYGELVGRLADRALAEAAQVRLTPLEAHVRPVFLPLENAVFRMGWQTGVLDREAFVWKGDPYRAERAGKLTLGTLCVETEIAWLRLGELDVACIPGEVYPELVLSRVQDPADPGADYPDAEKEPGIYAQLPGPHRMIIGLASDELGYIIPRRQWDKQPPYCYGRNKAQYGEINSLGPQTAPILCRAFQELVQQKK